jgi:hypothetical protein
MRVHQAVREHVPAIALGGLPEECQAEIPVGCIDEHRLPIVSIHSDVLNGAGIVDSRGARHGESLRLRL